MEGRRERKKQQTRQVISDVATALFLERGFDAVTVAEVARAADVAVQTVFNHFPAKEDLFFDQDGWWRGPARAVREADDETHPLDVLEAYYLAELRTRQQAGHLATWQQFVRTIEDSPALLARRRQNAAEMEALLTEALEERGHGRLKSRMIAAQFAAAQKVLEEELMRLLHREAAVIRPAEWQQAVAEVFGLLRHGLLTADSV
jgi:AcrR family transcriptional regulator